MVTKKTVRTARTKLKNLELGTKVRLSSGMTAYLIEKGIGTATVVIVEVPNTPSFYNEDGSVDTYWTGKQKWSPDTEVEVVK